MTLKEIKDWLKLKVPEIEHAYIGRTDPSQEKTICIYGRESSNNVTAIGGLSNTSTANKSISILVQWSKNCDTSEIKAKSIYDIFNGQKAVINEVGAFFMIKSDEPVPLGVNDNDIYEYIIDLNIIYKRG